MVKHWSDWIVTRHVHARRVLHRQTDRKKERERTTTWTLVASWLFHFTCLTSRLTAKGKIKGHNFSCDSTVDRSSFCLSSGRFLSYLSYLVNWIVLPVFSRSWPEKSSVVVFVSFQIDHRTDYDRHWSLATGYKIAPLPYKNQELIIIIIVSSFIHPPFFFIFNRSIQLPRLATYILM